MCKMIYNLFNKTNVLIIAPPNELFETKECDSETSTYFIHKRCFKIVKSPKILLFLQHKH